MLQKKNRCNRTGRGCLGAKQKLLWGGDTSAESWSLRISSKWARGRESQAESRDLEAEGA